MRETLAIGSKLDAMGHDRFQGFHALDIERKAQPAFSFHRQACHYADDLDVAPFPDGRQCIGQPQLGHESGPEETEPEKKHLGQ